MIQPQRFMQMPLAGLLLVCLLIGVYLLTSKRSEKPAPGVAKHTVDTNPEDALNYWTAEKKRDARPAEMPQVADVKRGKKRARKPLAE